MLCGCEHGGWTLYKVRQTRLVSDVDISLTPRFVLHLSTTEKTNTNGPPLELPQVTFDELPEGKLNMHDDLLTETTSPERPMNSSTRVTSSPLVGTTLRSGMASI